MSNSIKLSVDPVNIRVSPGSTEKIEISVQNLGEEKDVFSLEVVGLDESWYELSVSSAVLFPGDRTKSTLILSPPRDSSAVAREYPFTVTACCQQDGGQREDSLGVLAVERFYECSVVLKPNSATGTRVTYTVSLDNKSNFGVTFIPEGIESNLEFSFEFDSQRFSLEPGQRLDFPVVVDAGWRPLVAPTRPHPFTIILWPSQEDTGSMSLPGDLYVTHRIPLPTWIVPVAIGIGSMVGVAVWQLAIRV